MRRVLPKVGFWLLVIAIALFALFPFYYAVLTSFRSGTDLFGAYGIGLAVGFFLYYAILNTMVARSPNFDSSS